MSLKAFIQRLLDSRTTPAEAVRATLPTKENEVQITIPADTDSWVAVTAPFDGYFAVRNHCKSFLIQSGAGSLWCGSTGYPGNEYRGGYVPCKKGEIVGYQFTGTTGFEAYLYFVRTIGGGYKSLVRRASLCLKPSFNYSQKLFLLTRKNGFNVLTALTQINPRLSSCHHLLRPMMATCCLRPSAPQKAKPVATSWSMEKGCLKYSLLKTIGQREPWLELARGIVLIHKLAQESLSLTGLNCSRSYKSALLGGASC